MDDSRCKSCGLLFAEHDGISRTCESNRRLIVFLVDTLIKSEETAYRTKMGIDRSFPRMEKYSLSTDINSDLLQSLPPELMKEFVDRVANNAREEMRRAILARYTPVEDNPF